VTDSEAFAEQDGIDVSKWQTYLDDQVRYVSNKVLAQMLRDLVDEITVRKVDTIGETNDNS